MEGKLIKQKKFAFEKNKTKYVVRAGLQKKQVKVEMIGGSIVKLREFFAITPK